jgi:hypothetical protein
MRAGAGADAIRNSLVKTRARIPPTHNGHRRALPGRASIALSSRYHF